MTCKEFSSMIPAFMEDELDNDSLRLFLNHLSDCSGCREELEIQYLVEKLFNRSDVGEEINLSRDLPAYIEKERTLLRKRVRLERVAAVFESVTIAATIVTIILYLI